ncbi:hypothetical protein niasHT_000233 [Heterodera trifolii]|uniref:Uncharacterized protein n=1 Tax=Heterodera trifolii TaxID=157864 RepID=A0ABD2LYF2_9BILA
MSSAACPSSALLAAVARDELAPRRLSPSAASSSAGVPFANSDGATGGGPLGTLRRSLRQMNPFRSRLFRLPATPRLSRSKKVLARGEDFTGWNFERPSKASADSLRPFGTSFGSADVPPFAAPQTRPQRRRLSQMPSPALHSHCHQMMAGPGEQCGCCASGNDMDELDVFLSTMESIVRRGAPVGGSCRVMRHSDEQFEREEFPSESRGTVVGNGGAFARVTEAGTRRFRPPIPSFNPPSPLHPSACDSKRCPEAMPPGKHRIQLGNHREDEYQFLPSTCYAPDGKMFAASLFFLFGGTPQSLLVRCRTSLATILHDDNSLAGDSHLFASSAAQLANSPGQTSAISLLNTASAVTLAVRGTRSASAVSSGQQKKCVRSSSLFPKTQLQRRRSACSALSAGVGIAEETEENDGRTAGERANYYGREVIRLMEEEEEAQETHNKSTDAFLCRPSVSDRLAPCSLANPSSSSSSSPSLLPAPPPLFPPPDEIFTEVTEFVGREWLFRDLCHQLIIEHAQLILVHGASGSGKSALIRHIAAHSANFGDAYAQSGPADAQQHNTVDSGIAIGNGFSSTGSGGANSSGSQLSLLNLPVHLSADASASANVSALSSVQIHNEWLHTLAKNVVAVHFARLHNSLSCSIPEFARSICAQMCSSVQLKFTYGRMIRSDPRLHQLASHEAQSLDIEPFELFLELVCRPLAKLIKEEECQGRKNAAAKGRRSSSRSSDYGSNGGAYAANGANESRRPFASDAPILLVLVDSLDEAAFHRSDGGESIGWLLRRILSADGACPPQLRFVCTLLSPEGLPCQPPLLSKMLGTLDDKMAQKWPEAVRAIRLDDWEGDERIARDLRQFVEQRVNGSPALDKWIHAQFRRQSFFASPGPTANVPSVAEFGVQLVAHLSANFVGLKMALAMLAEGRLLSLEALPTHLDGLYLLHFRHKFPSSALFRAVSPILSLLFASLRPLSVDEMLYILNIAHQQPDLDESELRERLSQLSPFVAREHSSSSAFLPVHPSLREWLLREAARPNAEFGIDIRHSHILIALSLVNKLRSAHSSLSQETFFELAHHLLKANPHKYLNAELAARLGMPLGRECQVKWLKMAGGDLAEALLCRRNVFYPNSKVTRLLLLAGADPNASKWPGGAEEPLLCSFARSGNLEMVQLLLQFGANPNAGDPLPLIVAIENGHEEVIRVLCAHPGTDLFVRSTNGHGVLYHAAARDSIETVALLVDALGDADGKLGRKTGGIASRCIENERREASSHQRYSACSSSYEDEFQSHRLRQRMGDEQSTGKAADNRRDCANDRSQFIREAFEAAAARGSARVCRFLLDNTDAVVDMARGMCIACANGHSEVVQFLLSRGVTLSPEQKWDGKSALICAVESGSWDLVVNVLNSSSDGAEGTMDQLNRVVGPDGLSPLMVAARHGHVGLVDLLINRGAQLDLSDSHGRTAAMHGIEAGHSSTVALLLERGSALFARDSHGNTMLHLLGRHPNKCLIYRLLEDGLSLEDKNKEDLRPIEVAIRAGQLVAVDTFLRRGARLRSLTWQIALSSHPPLVLVLLRKLLDDAQILLRRKRTAEAQHRLSYALQKCDELLEKAKAEDNEALGRMGPQLRRVKVQAFHSMATLKRRCNDLSDAIALASNALELLDHHNVGGVPAGNSLRPPSRGSLGGEREEKTDAERRAEDEQRFELHLLRAKCHFDARDLERARVDAQLATCMKPEEAEAQNLLAVLSAGN